MSHLVKDGAPVLEHFILTHLAGRSEEFRGTERPQNHQALLQAALRRKKVKVQSVSPNYSNFTYGTDIIGGMDRMVTTLVSDLGRQICADKSLTKQHLELRGLPVPEGRAFNSEAVPAAASEYLDALGGPAVVKPVTGRSGAGITLGVSTAQDLKVSWERAVQAQLTGDDARQAVLVEELREGLDVRIFVVGEQAVSVLVRVPVYVIGDGRSTVHELLRAQERLRATHKHLAPHVPVIGEAELNVQGLSSSMVLPSGEVRLLRQQANIRDGGLPVDMTDQTNAGVKELAVEALWSIPGIAAGAVDLLVPSLASDKEAVVLEINAGANIVPHRYPAYGKPRGVAERIADEVLSQRA